MYRQKLEKLLKKEMEAKAEKGQLPCWVECPGNQGELMERGCYICGFIPQWHVQAEKEGRQELRKVSERRSR